jgi:hypothetical protein
MGNTDADSGITKQAKTVLSLQVHQKSISFILKRALVQRNGPPCLRVENFLKPWLQKVLSHSSSKFL